MASLDIPFAMFAPKNIELEDNDPMVRNDQPSQFLMVRNDSPSHHCCSNISHFNINTLEKNHTCLTFSCCQVDMLV